MSPPRQSPLRGAVVGCGFFAANHLHAWREIDEVEIVAVCDSDRVRAEAVAARFGVARSYVDAAAMLDEAWPDFVDIVTGVDGHRPLVSLCATAGVPVICQKPFARDMADARAMVDACAAAGVPLMVHENFRWQAPQRAIRAAVADGMIGTPTYARISFRHAHDIYANQPYLLAEERLAIMDLGIHLLDLARFHLGEVVRIFCRTQRRDPRVRGEDAASIVLDHASGAVSLIDLSFATRLEPDPFPQSWVRVEGDRGTVELDAGFRLSISRPGQRRERSVEPPVPDWGAKPWHLIQDSVVAVQRHWVDCLRQGREPETSGADNLRTLDLVLKAYESSDGGRALPIGEAG